MMSTKRIRGEDGFILAVAILAMVVVGAAVTAGYFIGNQEHHVGKSIREAQGAFYASNAGLQREYATWSIADRWTMKGGDSLPIGPVTLANGSGFRGMVTRLDTTSAADDDKERYYLIRVTGSARAPILGEEVRNLQAMLLRVRYYDFCCTAALTAKDTVVQAGNSEIDGTNVDPLAWGTQCDQASNDNVAGAEIECATCYERQGGASELGGNPATFVNEELQAPDALTKWDEVDYDFLKSKAEKIYPHGTTITNTAPAVTTDPSTGLPVCNKSVLNNWGEPTNALHPCFNYFPIIYAQGDLRIQSSAYGQGLLVVERNLFINGGYQFYGIVLVKGHVVTEGTAGKIYGSLVVAGQTAPGDSILNSRVAGAATVLYSSCAVMRAKRFAELAKKEPLPLRSWVEGLN